MPHNALFRTIDLQTSGNLRECSASNFIQAAIKTGFHVDSEARQSILRDISDILACNAEDLSFLYEIAPQEDAMLKVPCVKALLGQVTHEAARPQPYPANDIASFNEAAE